MNDHGYIQVWVVHIHRQLNCRKGKLMWTKIFDLSKRHCNRVETPNGTGYAVNGQFDILCSNPQDHPYAVGAPEYLRWIRFFGKRIGPGVTYGDGEDVPLKLGLDKTADGREIYC